MQDDQYHIHQKSGQYGLKNANRNGLNPGSTQLTESKFVTNGKRNKAQSNVGNYIQTFYLLQRIKSKAADIQSTQQERS